MNKAVLVGVGVVLALVFAFLSLHPNAFAKVLYGLDLPESTRLFLIAVVAGLYIPFSLVFAASFALPQAQAGAVLLPLSRVVRKWGLGKAVDLIALPMLFSLPVSILVGWYLAPTFPWLLSFIKPFVPATIALVAIGLIAFSPSSAKALVLFFYAGALGMFAFSLRDPFFPLFTGFFAVPFLLFPVKEEPTTPSDREDVRISFWHIMGGIALGFIAVLLPGVSSPSQLISCLAFIASMSPGAYLSFLSAFLPAQYIASFFLKMSAWKTRNGVVALFSSNLLFYAIVFTLAVGLGCFLAYLLVLFLREPPRLSRFVKLCLFFYYLALSYVFSGPFGIGVLLLGSFLGATVMREGVSRVVLLGGIMLPVLLFYLV